MSRRMQVLAFDIYGTLLDTSAIANALKHELDLDDARAGTLSGLWRRYQLELARIFTCPVEPHFSLPELGILGD